MKRFFLFGLVLVLVCAGLWVLWPRLIHNSDAQSAYSSTLPASPLGKCINMGGALEAPNEGEWGYRIRRKDFYTIKASGFDSVRIPIKWSAHASRTAPYTIQDSFFRRIDEVIGQALDADLKVIINVHHYNELNEDAQLHLPRLYAIWDQILARYSNQPEALYFEFLNEPHSAMTYPIINRMNRDLLKRVRSYSATRGVVIGGGHWGTLEGLVKSDPPYDPNAILTFHYYDPFEFTHQGAPWAHKQVPLGQTWGTSVDRQNIARDFSSAAQWAQKRGMPILLGEFGVYEEVPNSQRASWTEYVRQTAERVNFGWCYWDWATTLGAYDTQTESYYPGLEEALLGR